jgi:CRISPR-associated protein Cst2
MSKKNIFATVLTSSAPSANYRGESELNRTVLQKITKRNVEGVNLDYSVVSSEAMRNALREILASKNLPMNRTRLHNEDQLAVQFESFPNASKYADDFLFGFMVADTKAQKANKNLPSKRDSVLRMNIAVSLNPYNFDAFLHQSPLNAGTSTWKNAGSSALLYQEVLYTAYQYPFALSLQDCSHNEQEQQWTQALLNAIGELSNVAGGHARAYFEFSPISIVVRLTDCLVCGYDSYGFDANGKFKDLQRISANDLPGNEFWIGGDIVRNMTESERSALEQQGVHLFSNPQQLLKELSVVAFQD